MKKLNFVVQGKPVAKARPRMRVFTDKSGKFKGSSTYTPKKTANYETQVRVAAKKAMEEAGLPLLKGSCRLLIHAYWEWPKSSFRKTKPREEGPFTGKPDADNVMKIICDSINEVVYGDDKQVTHAEILKFRAKQGDPARVEVTLWSLEDEW